MQQKHYPIFLGLTLIFLLMISSAHACISVPKAVIYDDPNCIKSTWGSYENGHIEFSIYERNKTRIVESSQKYKDYTYTCLVPNNQQGDKLYCQYCGIGPNATCSDFRKWARDNNITFFDDWTCRDPGCTICHWRYVRTISLTDNDIEIIADFLANGYSVIRQTEDEYKTFLENAIAVNNNLSTCDYYFAVARRGNWTGYIFSHESSKTLACERAPRPKCANVFTNIIWNDLPAAPPTGPKAQPSMQLEQLNYLYFIVSLVILSMVIVFLILRFRKSRI